MGTKIKYENKDLQLPIDGKIYHITVNATADYYYQPCIMYFSDGSGQPEDEGWDIEEICATWRLDDKIIEPDEDLTELLEDYIADLDLSEWQFPEEPEYDEPEDY